MGDYDLGEDISMRPGWTLPAMKGSQIGRTGISGQATRKRDTSSLKDGWMAIPLNRREHVLKMEHGGLEGHEFLRWLMAHDVTCYMISPRKMHRYEIPEGLQGLGSVRTDRRDACRIAIPSPDLPVQV